MDVPDATAEHTHRMETSLGFKDSYAFQNLKQSLNQQCIGDFEVCFTSDDFSPQIISRTPLSFLQRDGLEEDAWRCMLPQYFIKYIKTPLFVIQSFADAYQVT